MTARDDDDLDRLLARGRLGGPTRDRILAGTLRAAEPRRRMWSRWWAFALPATAAVLLGFVFWPRATFRPKGAPAATFLDVSCGAGPGQPCHPGDTLLFHAGGVSQSATLAAWAEPEGGGERIWYFPAADVATVVVTPATSMQTLRRGVRLGSEHAPGRYLVHLVLARRPLTRGQALAPSSGDVLATAIVPLEVTP